MVPIYDTDIAQERWEKSDWETYELWERVEHRARRHRRIWIAATVVVFLVLSSVPIILDRSEKWATLAATRRLAQEINRIKLGAGTDHAAYRIRFQNDGSLRYRLEKSLNCSDSASTLVGTGALVAESKVSEYSLLSHAQGQEVGIPGLIYDICYDYLSGSDTVLKGDSIAGFGIIPVKDLPEGRFDRLSILLLNGPSAEISFD